MTTEELDRLAKLRAAVKYATDRQTIEQLEAEYYSALNDAAPSLIALARWAERAEKFIREQTVCSDDTCGRIWLDLINEAPKSDRCKLLAAYPKKAET